MSKPSNEKQIQLSCKEHHDAPSFYACLEEFNNPHVVRPLSWSFDDGGELVTDWAARKYPYVIPNYFEGHTLGWTAEESRRAARQLVEIFQQIPAKHSEHVIYTEICATEDKDVVFNTYAAMRAWQTAEKGHATTVGAEFLLWNLRFDVHHPEWDIQYKGAFWLGYQVYRLLNDGLPPHPAFAVSMMYWFYPSHNRAGKDHFQPYSPPMHASPEQSRVLEKMLSFHQPDLWFATREEAAEALRAVL